MDSEKAFNELEMASGRVGHSSLDIARWFIRFGYLDLGVLSEGSWLDLRWEFEAIFGHWDLAGWVERVIERGEPYSQAEVVESHVLQVGFLLDLKERGGWEPKEPLRVEGFLKATGDGLRAGWRPGREQDYLYFVQTWVFREAGDRFRTCLDCGIFFIRSKRQAYCSIACSQRTRTRAYRKRRRKTLGLV